jgi:hypothetical protein
MVSLKQKIILCENGAINGDTGTEMGHNSLRDAEIQRSKQRL